MASRRAPRGTPGVHPRHLADRFGRGMAAVPAEGPPRGFARLDARPSARDPVQARPAGRGAGRDLQGAAPRVARQSRPRPPAHRPGRRDPVPRGVPSDRGRALVGREHLRARSRGRARRDANRRRQGLARGRGRDALANDRRRRARVDRHDRRGPIVRRNDPADRDPSRRRVRRSTTSSRAKGTRRSASSRTSKATVRR